MRKWFPLLLALALCLLCTAAMAECDHRDLGLVPNTDGTHSHICNVCGEDNGKEECADSCDDGDTACDWCGSTAGKANNYHFDDPTCRVEGGKHVVTCGCGVVVGTYEPIAMDNGNKLFHDMGCWYCFGANGTPEFHTGMGSGSANGADGCSFTCSDCGYTHNGSHYAAMGGGDGFHGTSCYVCGYWTWKEDCYENCADKDGECDVCGSADLTVIHGETTSAISGGKCNHVCNDCGETLESCDLDWIPEEARPSGKTGHFAECPECGKEGANETPHNYKYSTTADTHRAECTVCGWAEEKEEHTYTDGNDLECDVCGLLRECEHDGETVCTPNGSKHDVTCARCGEALESVKLTWGYTEGGHCTECAVCGETSTEEAHTITYKTSNTTHAAKCDVCGYEAAAEEHVYADENDNDCDVCGKQKQCEHTHWYKVPKAATCTEDGIRVNYCNLCGKEHSTQSIPAKGHDLTSKDMGDYILESCSRCDYKNKIEKQAEQPVEQTEQAAEAAPVTDGLQVTDVDMEAETAIQLPEKVSAAKVFSVAYMEDGEAVQPEAAMTVTLALTEEDLSAVEGLKLMLILEDGTMVEVPYEVIDGQIVFTAEQLGTFAFVAE